jgi:sorbitol-specific phosphotransferase system component IIBC
MSAKVDAIAQAGDGVQQTRSSLASSVLSLFASSSTLICCALPALLVALGAGAALSGLVGAFPQIVWLSEHKVGLFTFAGLMLAASGCLQWFNRNAPCPIDPALRDACLRTRKVSVRVYWVSVGIYLVGGFFAFVLPWLSA